jgi:hypothetical protein
VERSLVLTSLDQIAAQLLIPKRGSKSVLENVWTLNVSVNQLSGIQIPTVHLLNKFSSTQGLILSNLYIFNEKL